MQLFLLSTLVASGIMDTLEVSHIDLIHWKSFKVQHGKKYKTTAEEQMRKEIFMNNLKYIREHNLKHSRGNVNYTLGINRFADMTHEEFRKRKSSLRVPRVSNETEDLYVYESHSTLPKKKDWRRKGAVSPVKDEGMCNACWAFSAIGGLEGQFFIKNKRLVILSEQNLIDCSYKEGNHGCRTGMISGAFKYVKRNGGVATESWYPYTAKDGACRCGANYEGTSASGYVRIPTGDEDALKAAIAKVGPISVAIDGETADYHLYSSGIFDDNTCSTIEVNTAMLAVGYGHCRRFGDYYILKNSLGTSWGKKGYMLIARNKNNICGVASLASYPKF